jgi:hypothetical protein
MSSAIFCAGLFIVTALFSYGGIIFYACPKPFLLMHSFFCKPVDFRKFLMKCTNLMPRKAHQIPFPQSSASFFSTGEVIIRSQREFQDLEIHLVLKSTSTVTLGASIYG